MWEDLHFSLMLPHSCLIKEDRNLTVGNWKIYVALRGGESIRHDSLILSESIQQDQEQAFKVSIRCCISVF